MEAMVSNILHAKSQITWPAKELTAYVTLLHLTKQQCTSMVYGLKDMKRHALLTSIK